MQSEYFKKLMRENQDIGERYKLKLRLLNGLDPFTLNADELDYSIYEVPPVTNMDIISYLVLTHNFYTKEQMRAFKSLQSYKYFESGFVLRAGTKIINEFYILVGKVKHSQKANLKPLDVWCIVAKDGSVCTAHCTCMAGNSEVCSHVGAILFAAEYANNKKNALSCTDVQAAWPMPSTSTHVPIVPVREMNWGKVSNTSVNRDIPPLSPSEINQMLQNMSDLGQTSVLMRIVEPFATKISAESVRNEISVLDIFDMSNMSKDYKELMEMSKNINIDLNKEHISNIEETTRGQNINKNWYTHRAGRITASKFKAVCKTNKNRPSISIIKSICYPTKVLFTTKATSWGLLHEKDAIREYQKQMEEENHINFQIKDVGLMISSKWQQFAVSPDGLVNCECCLGGCLEVKCPYLLYINNTQHINEYISMKNCCLIKVDGKITINKEHSYYYQVQMQMFVSQLSYCDFVIWSPQLFYKERIFPDSEFWEVHHKIALKFHSEVIMPELLGRFFTKKEGMAKVINWCLCQGVDDGKPMIRCDGDSCEIEWFHFECVQITDIPNCAWYCSNCNKN